jgi:hypothetical protein
MRRRSSSTVSVAPIAVTSSGEVVINAAKLQDEVRPEAVARYAASTGLTVFIGLVVPPEHERAMAKDVRDAAAALAGRVGERLVRAAGSAGDTVTSASELPRLDEWLVEADEELADVVDALVRLDGRARERQAAIEDAFELVRLCADNAGTVSMLEEARGKIAEREADLLCAVARWAFDQGRRYPLPGEAGSS